MGETIAVIKAWTQNYFVRFKAVEVHAEPAAFGVGEMNPKLFGPKLKALLKLLDIEQAELAELTSLTPAAISQILNGKREPSLGTICKILKHIPIKLEKLVT